MKPLPVFILSVLFLFVGGCETTSSRPPLVTPAMASGHNGAVLREGRALFVSRCIDCHSLPPVPKYSAQQWPGLVSKMAGRAHLKPAQRDAIVAYLLAARAQP
jgi:mono/diheme cytochrome c family protein